MNQMRRMVPSITINGKEHCINIGRDVIRALGYPSHICILEHDKWHVIAVTSCDDSELLSFRVPEGFPDEKKKKFRIYSQSLIQEIMNDCSLDVGDIYNVKGEYIDAMKAVLFHMSE